MRIGNTTIGQPGEVFIIAEGGVNHNGDPELARQLVVAAADAGADAVKFQTFIPSKLVSATAPRAGYQQLNAPGDETQEEMLRKLVLPVEELAKLKPLAEHLGIQLMSTPFDEQSADELREIGVPAIKISSGEITNYCLLHHVASFGIPIILSTGMSTLGEIEDAITCLTGNGCEDLALLHCVSAYPAPVEDTNMRVLSNLRFLFKRPVGYSDHTLGTHVSVGAVAIGATIIEKHMTMDRNLPGPDHACSVEPDEMKQLVRQCREMAIALGDGSKRIMACEVNTREVAQRSVTAAQDMPAGTVLLPEMLTLKRPSTGIHPIELNNIIGRQLKSDVHADETLTWSHL